MDTQEAVAMEFLEGLGLGTVVYEPDGNIPPDFSIGGDEIGVEVRRLNQNYFPDDGSMAQGLENAEIHIWKTIEEVVASFDTTEATETYFVKVRFQRPVECGRNLRRVLTRCFADFLAAPSRGHSEQPVATNMTIGFAKGAPVPGKPFLLGISGDSDSGGWLVPMAISNIRMCISEKTAKIQSYLDRYKRWWLVLIDHIRLDLMNIETAMISSGIEVCEHWEKVYVIDSEKRTLSLVLSSNPEDSEQISEDKGQVKER